MRLMGKKKHASPDALLEARVLRESEWAYRGWLAHKTAAQLRIEANRSPADGGLGYDLGIAAIRGLIEKGRELHGEQAQHRDAMIERELLDLDLVQQLAGASMRKAAEASALDVHASKLYLDAGAQRRKLLGLDAATKVEAEVVHRDAVMEELDAALARLTPKETTR